MQNKNNKKPMNPLSSFFIDKNGNRVDESVARIAKLAAFAKDVYKKQAIDPNGRMVTLGEKNATEDNVDFIGGMWRIQSRFPHEITIVRKKEMILLKKLDREEHTGFEFYTAKSVGYNCFGPFISKTNGYDYIVAKCNTDRGAFWGYGPTMDDARAYLCLKLYDECQDVILGMLCNKTRNNKK